MQYKLIEHPKQKGEWLAVSEQKRFVDDYYVGEGLAGNNVFKWSESQAKTHPYFNGNIIASSIFIDNCIPLMRKEQLKLGYTEDPIDQELDHISDSVRNKHFDRGFESGYNKRAGTHPYTSDNLVEFYYFMVESPDVSQLMRKMMSPKMDGSDNIHNRKIVEQCRDLFLQSLKQTKEYIIEFEMGNDYVKGRYSNICAVCDKEFHNSDKLWFICPDHPYVKVDKEGYVNITSIKPI